MSDVSTMRFDAGESSGWYLVPQISDSGDELRSKVIKSLRITGRVTSASARLYTWGPKLPINVSYVEDGTNSASSEINLSDSTSVIRSRRYQTNCPNATLHTVRIAGEWEGGMKNRIDEIVYEVASQGVRR